MTKKHFVHYLNHAGFCRRGYYPGATVEDAAIAIVLDHCPFIRNYDHRFEVVEGYFFTDINKRFIRVEVHSPEKNCNYKHKPEFWFSIDVMPGAPDDCEPCAGTGWYVGQGSLVSNRQCWKCGSNERDEKGLALPGRGTGKAAMDGVQNSYRSGET